MNPRTLILNNPLSESLFPVSCAISKVVVLGDAPSCCWDKDPRMQSTWKRCLCVRHTLRVAPTAMCRSIQANPRMEGAETCQALALVINLTVL